MSTATPTTMPSSTAKSSPKTAKKSLIVKLVISPDRLARFPFKPTSKKTSSSNSVTQSAASPSIQPPEASPADKSSESNSTPQANTAADPADSNSLAPPPATNGRKRGGGNVSGRKRAPPSLDPDKPRARPGPKKKPRLADGTIDRSTDPTKKGPTVGPVLVNTHKLGPKANQGAINAGLRALDRTGKPCRKWEKKGLQLKSFTGTHFSISSWRAPQRDSSTFSGDVKSDSTGSSDLKPNNDISVMPSERSSSAADADGQRQMHGIESSPAPPIAAVS